MTGSASIQLPDAFPWGLAVIDAVEGRILSHNTHMDEIYLCAVGVQVDRLFSMSDGASFSAAIQALGEGQTWNGRIYPRNNRYGIDSVEVMLEREAGDVAQVWLYTLEHPKVDNQVRYSSRSELKMLRVLLDNTLGYIFFRDVEGQFILTNKAFRDAVSDGQMMPDVDKRIEDFVSTESAEWFARLDRQLVDTGHAVVNEVGCVTLNCGLEHWLQLSTVPVRNGEGELIGTLSVALDISELKRTEGDLRHAIDQARAASRAKGEFLAAISHEIRTPINGIIGASELCEETRLDREQRNYIDTVLQCGETLLSLVNDVLDFSKIEAGQLNLEKLNFVPRALLESVAESFMQETRKRGIELITAYDEKLPHYLMGDPTRLKQVLNNLVSNAVKFTETGEIVIRVETLELAEESARVRFSVSDTGIGISEARQDAIFESFTQEDMSTTRKYGGTGLGLSISRELVQLMEGEIQLKSELGKGSTFSFEVNFERSAYPGAEAVPFNPEPAEMRILIVEDNPVNQAVAEQRLKKLGHEVTVAGDSYEALETILKKRFDCILMDIQMPGMDGYQTTAEIRKFEKEHEIDAQYIVAMTAHAMKGDEERCLSVGMDNYIAKPFRVERLKEVLHLAAGHKRRKKGAGSAPSYSYAGYLAALSKADREDLMDAGRILLQSLPADIEKLNKAMAAKDFKQCSFQAHTLKSVVAHFGHEVATSLAEELEKASEKEQEIEVLSLAREFIESLQALTAQIEAECEKFRA